MKHAFNYDFIARLYKTKKNKIIKNLTSMISQIESKAKEIEDYFEKFTSIDRDGEKSSGCRRCVDVLDMGW